MMRHQPEQHAARPMARAAIRRRRSPCWSAGSVGRVRRRGRSRRLHQHGLVRVMNFVVLGRRRCSSCCASPSRGR
ncbi:MAG: hypothetical protein MZV70_50475 [Desulfobacterales bacterium]|nr:hypothetical protein [Desulfobacterales bacterium]